MHPIESSSLMYDGHCEKLQKPTMRVFRTWSSTNKLNTGKWIVKKECQMVTLRINATVNILINGRLNKIA